MARMPVRMRPSDPFFSSRIQDCNLVACVFKFVDLTGCVLHTIDGPEDQLPVPAYRQEVSIGPMRMWVISVMLSSTSPQTDYVRVANSGERLSR